MGDESSCLAADIGPMPEDQQECEDYSDCPYDPMCPLGRGGAANCTTQMATLLVFIVVLAVCVVAYSCRRLYHMSRVKSEGRVQLMGGIWGTYRIVRQTLNRGLSLGTRGDLERGDVPTGKTRIIWQVDLSAMERFFERGAASTTGSMANSRCTDSSGSAEAVESSSSSSGGGSGEEQPRAARDASSTSGYRLPVDMSNGELDQQIDAALSVASTSPSRSMKSSPSPKTRRSSNFEELLRKGLRLSLGCGQPRVSVFPAFVGGQKVEYYSGTHARWLPGVIHVKPSVRRSSSGERQQLSVRYDVELGHGQSRCHVALDHLREPLQEDELVEVFSRRRGSFLHGVVDGAQGSSAATLGYRISLEGAEVALSAVPASHVRRRFPPGQGVRVYRGPERGWATAVVVPEQQEAGAGRLRASLPQEGLPALLGSAASPANSGKSPKAGRDRSSGSLLRLVSRGQLPELPGPAPAASAETGRGEAGLEEQRFRSTTPPRTPGGMGSPVGVSPMATGTPRSPRVPGGLQLRGLVATPRGAAGALLFGAASALRPRSRLATAAGQPGARAPGEAPRGAWPDYPEARSASKTSRYSDGLAGCPGDLPCGLRISIFGASGSLSGEEPGGEKVELYCACEVSGKPQTRFETQVASNPIWNYEASVIGYCGGDDLEFTVKGKDSGKADGVLGRATLTSGQFNCEVFEGEVPLAGSSGASLNVRVEVAGGAWQVRPDLWEWVPVVAASELCPTGDDEYLYDNDEPAVRAAGVGGKSRSCSPQDVDEGVGRASRRSQSTPEWFPSFLVRSSSPAAGLISI